MAARKSIEERFWALVDRRGDDECWPWLGNTNRDGYGLILHKGRVRKATHVAWELLHGEPFPKGAHALHRGDEPGCTNAARCIFLGTQADNMADMTAKGRRVCGERHGNARLTTAKVLEIRARLARGETQRVVAAAVGIAQSAVSNVANRRAWRHV